MKRLMKFLLAAGAALCVLTACGGDDTTLETYTLEESGETVVALDSILTAGEAVMTSIDKPTDAAAQAGLKMSHTYHYGQMEDPTALAVRYINVLREDEGFTPIDPLNRQLAEEPDLETLTGSMILARKLESSDTKKICRVVVGWSEYAVAVQVAEVDGRILPPPEPEKETSSDGSGSMSGGSKGSSITEQLDYFNTLNPQKLGLEGTDMTEYTVYPQQGRVTVDGISCRQIMVYQENAKGENTYIGTFFLSSDQQHMFKKVDDGRIVAVENFQ